MDEVLNKTLNGMKKLGKLAVKIFKSLISFVLHLFAIIGPIGFAILIFVLFCYFVVMEFEGKEKRYSDKENQVESMQVGDVPSYVIKKMRPENDIVLDFFKYYSLKSLWQVDVRDKSGEKLINMSEEDAVTDYYGRESKFILGPNFLFNLNKYVYEDTAYYPEAFIKPVYYDKETFKLKDLCDEHGGVIAKSKQRSKEDGSETGKIIESVSDYGLGSVLKFKEMEFSKHLKGMYVKQDVYNPATGEVEQEGIIEQFDIELPNDDEEKKYIIEKALTFSGEIEFEYEKGEDLRERVQAGESDNEKDNVEKILYDTAIVRELDEMESLRRGEDVYIEKRIPLYKYRSTESGVFNNVEVPTGVKKDESENPDKYYYDYLTSFASYVPEDTLKDLVKRIDYEVLLKEEENIVEMDSKGELIGGVTNIGGLRFREDQTVGSLETSGSMVKHEGAIKKYADEFGIDPFVISAMIMQESGGREGLKDGICQIVGTGTRKVSATTKNGEKVVVSITNRQDSEASIRFMCAMLKSFLERYNGDYLLSMHAYNQGPGTADYIIKNYPDLVRKGEWLDMREEARRYFAARSGYEGAKSASQFCLPQNKRLPEDRRRWGDSCYLENVMRYYKGNNNYLKKDLKDDKSVRESDPLAGVEKEKNIQIKENAIDKITEAIKDLGVKIFKGARNLVIKYSNTLNKLIRKYEKSKYNYYVNPMTPSIATDIRRFTQSFNQAIEFSNTDLEKADSISDIGFIQGFTGGIESERFYDIDNFDLSKYAGMGGYIPPLDKFRVSSEFGGRGDPLSGNSAFHLGIDLAAPNGTPIHASQDGIVVDSRPAGSYGEMILIKHSDTEQTRYAHMSRRIAQKGDRVKKGEVIGLVGSTGRSTGNHLHFEWIINGKVVNPRPIVDKLLMEPNN